MRPELFHDIVRKIAAKKKYFQLSRDAAGVLSFSPDHKCVVGIKMLAYGGPADSIVLPKQILGLLITICATIKILFHLVL
jgi:hypothetical protein